MFKFKSHVTYVATATKRSESTMVVEQALLRTHSLRNVAFTVSKKRHAIGFSIYNLLYSLGGFVIRLTVNCKVALAALIVVATIPQNKATVPDPTYTP